MTWDEFLETPMRDLPWWAFAGVCLLIFACVAVYTRPWKRR